MRTEWSEGQLEFDFSSALRTCQPDKKAEPLSTVAPPLKSVDFYVWYPGLLWLIEVKDPDSTPPKAGAQKAFYSEMKNDALLKEHILPKLYGACAHLAIENVDLTDKIRCGIVVGLRDLSNADRHMLTDKIDRIVRQIGPKLGFSNDWPGTEVHSLESWNDAHPEMKVSRDNTSK